MSRKQFSLPGQWSLWLCLLAVAFCSMALVGCGGQGREALEGTVTLDGKPLEKGYITFRPQPGTASPSAGADIADGKFSVASKGGVLPGKFRVEITASRTTDKKIRDRLTGNMVSLEEQYIPAKYNNASKLEAEIGASGRQRLDFAITSR
jgi:hypothetical protein